MPNLTQHRFAGAALALAGTAVLVLTLHLSGLLPRLEWLSYDLRMQVVRSDTPGPNNVAVILIDEASLKTVDGIVGRWPWPRSLHADILDFIAAGNPRAVAFDILFSEHESSTANKTPSALSDNDQRLVESTANAAAIHAMQIYTDHADEINSSLLNRPLPRELDGKYLAADQLNAFFSVVRRQSNNNFYSPLPALAAASSGIGIVSAEPDADGVYRRVRLLHNYQGHVFPSLGFAPLLYDNGSISKTQLEHYQRLLQQNGTDGELLINYYGSISTYSMSGVIASAQQAQNGDVEHLLIDPAEFKDKIVFIGASAAGLEDLKTTPLSAAAPGVYLHAATAANLLSDDLLYRWPPATDHIVSLILAIVAIGSIFGLNRIHAQVSAIALLMISYVAASIFAFEHHQVVAVAQPMLALFIAASLSFLFMLFTEGRDRRRIKTMLSQYVSPAVLDSVLQRYQDQLDAEVGSEECLTILFSDIRGFTHLSETLPPAKVVEMLNHYFSEMTDAIFCHEGTIDKFIGDAIMAFWGAPIRDGLHAIKGVRAAMEMHNRLKDVNEWLSGKGYPAIDIGVGLNTGQVILGNIGSSRKLDYTVIGDNVNLASRLEGLTKPYGCPIIISEYTYQQLNGQVPCYLVDLVRVKGKQHPIKIYAPIIDHDLEQASELARISEVAFGCYLARDWEPAITSYQQLPESGFQRLFVERCRGYQQAPPPSDWDGVYTMTTK